MRMNGVELAIRQSNGRQIHERLVQIDRPNRACCGCCACFEDVCGQDEWRGLNGHSRRGCGRMGIVLGGIAFGGAIASIVLMMVLVWSIDSFADFGSGSGMY